MADDTGQRGPQDASRVSLSEDYEVEYWTKRFGVTREELQDAVHKVGNSACAVGAHLAG